MKLELKHLAVYLPYGLKGVATKEYMGIETMRGLTIDEITTDVDSIDFDDWNPILRPLSDLSKEIEVNGERFVPIDIICEDYGCIEASATMDDFGTYNIYDEDEKQIDIIMPDNIHLTSYGVVEKLFEWKFDVYNLIQNGLAIDINKL